MPLAKTAYIDESLRIGRGLYLLAAVIVADTDADNHRAALQALLYRGQLRLHWRDESTQRRTHLIAAMHSLRHIGAIVIAAGAIHGRQERARRKRLERLLTELVSRGITTVIFERRHPDLDARDRTMIAALQRQHTLPTALRASWKHPIQEPLLWLPDIAAGAASLAEAATTLTGTTWPTLSLSSGSRPANLTRHSLLTPSITPAFVIMAGICCLNSPRMKTDVAVGLA